MTVRFTPLAETEIRAIGEWYEDRGSTLREGFLDSVRETAAKVDQSPSGFRRVQGEWRRAPVSGFPYALYYAPEPGGAIVVARLHSSRDPQVAHDRLRDS